MESQYKILAQTPNACVSQCYCCTQLQVQYNNVLMCFEWTDLTVFLHRLNELPSNHPYYVINIIDLRCHPTVKLGVSASAICLNFSELEELITIITMASQKIDLTLLFKKTFHHN